MTRVWAKALRFLFRNEVTLSLAANRLAQRGIREVVREMNYTRGIGAGAGIGTSGEQILPELLTELDGTKTVFDVGANEGAFTELIGSEVDNTKVHLFEPQRKLCERLKATFSNRAERIVNCFALSDEASQTTLYYDEEGSGLASMSKRQLNHYDIEFDTEEEIETRTVDGYCDEMAIDEIDLLKLDVEGHELDVLTGAERMISQQNVRFVSFEFGGANIDSRTFFQDYYYFFEQNGYQIYRILPNNSLVKITQYDEVEEIFQTTNYLAARSEL